MWMWKGIKYAYRLQLCVWCVHSVTLRTFRGVKEASHNGHTLQEPIFKKSPEWANLQTESSLVVG